MSTESLRILFEFIGAVVVALMTYFFTRSHYEKKRQDDLADRDFNRRAATYDIRVMEAREYVDAVHHMISWLITLNSIFREETNPQRIALRIKEIDSSHKGELPSIGRVTTNMDSIGILNDAQLTGLHELLTSYFPRIHEWAKDLEPVSPESIQQKKEEADEFLRFLLDANNVVIQIKSRLDKLSHTVP